MLVSEILGVYVVTRWHMPRGDIRQVMTSTRAHLEHRPSMQPASGQDSWEVAAHLGRAVYRTLRVLPTDSRCLVQALVLSRMLAARGIPSTLIIGAHVQPDFKAHAWVEHEGRPVLPPRGFQDSRLVEL